VVTIRFKKIFEVKGRESEEETKKEEEEE